MYVHTYPGSVRFFFSSIPVVCVCVMYTLHTVLYRDHALHVYTRVWYCHCHYWYMTCSPHTQPSNYYMLYSTSHTVQHTVLQYQDTRIPGYQIPDTRYQNIMKNKPANKIQDLRDTCTKC